MFEPTSWDIATRKRLNNQSYAEKLLYKALRKKLRKVKRNFCIHYGPPENKRRYFVDFCILLSNLFVEIDGKEHDKVDDWIREQEILKYFPRFEFIRFTNEEVFRDTKAVVKAIRKRHYDKIARWSTRRLEKKKLRAQRKLMESAMLSTISTNPTNLEYGQVNN